MVDVSAARATSTYKSGPNTRPNGTSVKKSSGSEMKSIPTVPVPLTCSSMPGTLKITENMTTVAMIAMSVSSATMIADAFTMDCLFEM